MPDDEFLAVRQKLLHSAAGMSCVQALELADLLHTVIRMRRPHRPLRNLDHLLCEESYL